MGEPIRVMLDTNIYGLIANEADPETLVEAIANSNVLVCGSKVVRNELRKIPNLKNEKARKLRSDVLKYYNVLVKGKRDYQVNRLIQELAEEYRKSYAKSGSEGLKNDFLIVATASIHQVKIVCSDDEKTMKSAEARKSYSEANSKFEIPKPEFISLKEFKQLIR